MITQYEAKVIDGINVMRLLYFLVMGEWPEVPGQVVQECLDRAKTVDAT